jgi:hypothetical protein
MAKQRGRKSAAKTELAVAGLAPTVTAHVRPEPPYDLFDEQADVFRSIVNSLPADWFSAGSVPILAQLCKHVVASRRIAELVAQEERSETYDWSRHDEFLKAQGRESMAIQRLSTALRLTNQSRYTPTHAATEAGSVTAGRKPWETVD